MKNYIQSAFFYLAFLTLAFSFQSCKEENIPFPIGSGSRVNIETLAVNDWILSSMNHWYLWEEDIPCKLNNIASHDDSKKYFNAMLHKTDKWSWITDDYEEYTNKLNGIYKAFGFTIDIHDLDKEANTVYFIVKFVVKNSPAELAGMKRGHIITVIDDKVITKDDYETTLGKDVLKFELSLYNTTNKTFTLDKTVTIVKQQVHEDPIYTYKAFSAGSKKIGYMMYNSFAWTPLDSAKMVAVMSWFKHKQINELVLDFRYNKGGSIKAAKLLASLIAPEQAVKNEEIYSTNIHNEKMTENYRQNSPEKLVERFRSDLPVNLNLSRVFFLAQESSASASEMMILCMRPYMQVTHIGKNTLGKYTTSRLLDWDWNKNDRCAYEHNWGMAPIIAKFGDKNYTTDFVDGLVPDVEVKESLFYPLGSPTELMLNKALTLILSQPSTTASTKSTEIDPLGDAIGEFTENEALKSGILYQ